MNGTVISDVKSKTMMWGNITNQGKTKKTQEQDCFSAVFDKTQNPSQNNSKGTFVKAEDAETIQKHTDIRETKTSRQLKEQGEKVKDVKNNKIEELTLLDFKANYKIMAIKIVWYCQKNKHIDQWERMKSMEIDSHK